MIPILFESNETEFTTNGIGRLADVISLTAVERRNGKDLLTMEYPLTGAHFEDIIPGRFLYVKPAPKREKQAYEIYKIRKLLNGHAEIYAQHISYRLSLIPTMPQTAQSVSEALQGLKTNAAERCPFTFWTNKSTTAAYKQTVPASIRQQLGGSDGSILDVYGGEYEFDMYAVKLWESRGTDRGVSIRYGKNLTDMNQEESIENTITGIIPYYTDTEGNTVTGDLIESSYVSNYPYPRTVAVDVSEEFDAVPAKAKVNAAGQAYLASHSIGVPEVSLTVSFVNLSDTLEYKDIAVFEDIQLCDTVGVYFERLGVNAKAKVVEIEYDCLDEKITKIELGSARSSLSSKVASMQGEISKKPSASALQQAVNNATDLISGETGGYVILHRDDSGKPYEILIMDTEDINTAKNVWRWNKAGWGHSSTGYNGPYTLAATLDGGFVADYITSGEMSGNRVRGGVLEIGGTGLGADGILYVKNAKGQTLVTLDKNGLTLSNGQTISYADVSGAPTKLSAFDNDSGYQTETQVTKITKDTVTTAYVNALEITAASVAAENLTGTTITGKKITSQNNLLLIDTTEQTPYMRLGDNSGSDKMTLTNGSITFGHSGGIKCNAIVDGEGKIYQMIYFTLNGYGQPLLYLNGAAGIQILCSSPRSNGIIMMASYGDISIQAVTGNVNIRGTGFFYNGNAVSASDKKLKKDISSLTDDTVEFIYSLNPVKYKFTDGERFHHGLIAQEVKNIMPEDWGLYVDTAINSKSEDDDKNVLGLRYEELIADIILTLQSQNERLKRLEATQ